MPQETPQKQYTVMIARFPQGRCDDPDTTDWFVTTVVEMHNDPRVGEILRFRRDDTPITMSRNHCMQRAIESKADFLLMVDSDMSPDCNLESNHATLCSAPWAKPFWSTSFDFCLDQRAKGTPCVVGAPYLGPSPINNVYVFLWATDCNQPLDTHVSIRLAQYSREHAAQMRGITEVAALPTGLILIDMEGFRRFAENSEPPYFYYEYPDQFETDKASTEDVTFTRDMSLAGVKQYCNWDAWCGHWKRELVLGPPQMISASMLSEKFQRAVIRDWRIQQDTEHNRSTLVEAKDGKIRPIARDDLNTRGQPTALHAAASPSDNGT